MKMYDETRRLSFFSLFQGIGGTSQRQHHVRNMCPIFEGYTRHINQHYFSWCTERRRCEVIHHTSGTEGNYHEIIGANLEGEGIATHVTLSHLDHFITQSDSMPIKLNAIWIQRERIGRKPQSCSYQLDYQSGVIDSEIKYHEKILSRLGRIRFTELCFWSKTRWLCV